MTASAATLCAASVSTFGNTANHSPIQSGIGSATGVVPIQPANCISWMFSPTITTSTAPSKMPVSTSMRLYGSRWWARRVSAPTTSVNAAHTPTPASTVGPPTCSRILRSFQRRGLLSKQPSAIDGRQHLLRLTPKGQRAFQALNDRSQQDLEAMLAGLPLLAQSRLVDAMEAIESLLGAPATPTATPAEQPSVAQPPVAQPSVAQPPAYVLRAPRPGDLGWVVARHGAIYAQEYGWDEGFEALVAEIVAGFVQHYDARRERCWIAELDGENVGSVLVVRKTDTVAKLRWLLVEPRARGLGLGAGLVDECLSFARQAGYRQMTLWTNSVLVAARHLYAKAGFKRVDSGPHHAFGHDLVEETWLVEL
jgi:GNAT superfamily N-acetyltransferase